MPKLSSKAVWAIAIILAVFVFDQLTKYLILREEAFQAFACLKGEAMCGRIELSSVMDFSMVWNKGFSFGLAQAEGIWRWVLTLAVLCIGGMFVYWLIQAEHTLTAVSLALVVGGALGNLVDRIRFGAVVDFFDFSGPWFGIEFPIPDFLRRVEAIFANGIANTDGKLGLGFPYVFNIADAAITIGAILLFIDQFLLNRHDADAGKA